VSHFRFAVDSIIESAPRAIGALLTQRDIAKAIVDGEEVEAPRVSEDIKTLFAPPDAIDGLLGYHALATDTGIPWLE
jgi:hypothetical protein